ncbi:MAG: phosphomannomutase/phosphoglucomutase [Bacteroidales bacterium]|jgi:phosphomannomutase|nr:phosphomannomutase/phosphoglucomutase [Bacteroidales bacterium]
MGAFKSYDIRGVWNKDFNAETVYKVGFFLPELLKADKILVGRDVRTSSPEIFEALCKGITDAGVDVYDIGLSTTPLIYWATAKFNFDASVMITASHNPKEYNGLKVSGILATPIGYDSGLKIIEQWILDAKAITPKVEKGKIINYPVDDAYIDFQKQWISDFSNLKIAMDCSNGMSSLFVKKLYGTEKLSYIFDDMDGSFPNHEPNPLEPENIIQIQEKVKDTKADIGVIFDGDSDRVMFVDENSKFISPDLLIGILGNYFMKNRKNAKALIDIRSSKAIPEYLAPMGVEVDMWKVGRANAAVKLREMDGLWGGELAGHYYFKDFYYSDSALLACSLLLGIFAELKKKGISVSQAISKLATYANSGEINFKIEKKQAAMDAVRDYFMKTENCIQYFDFDGYRLEFADWWLNIRPSNTEPYLRFLAEAKSDEKLKEVVDKSREIIAKYA